MQIVFVKHATRYSTAKIKMNITYINNIELLMKQTANSENLCQFF